MKNKRIKIVLLGFVFLMLNSEKSFSQNNASAIANADTTNFSVNANGEWQLYNSYVALYGTDSVVLEITVQHANNINWSQEQYVGKVKTPSLRPATTQTVGFTLIADNYSLKVQNDGKCYLKLVAGPPLGQIRRYYL